MRTVDLNMKVHPAIVALVVALSIVAIGIKVWADGESRALGGPSQLLTDPSGNIYVLIQNQLLQHDQSGNFQHRHDLGDLSVDVVIGAIGFFSDGDILLRRGPDQRSLADNISAFQRKENSNTIDTEIAQVGLARCDLNTLECFVFGASPIDLQSTFGLYIDWLNDDVIISDTERHTLRKYSANGVEVAGPTRGFNFPNQLKPDEGALLVADTNNHRIAVVESTDASFGEVLQSIDVVPSEADRRNERWPSHFAKVGDEWWVNNMRNDMRNGGIYAFDEDWSFKRRISLPDDADPISILAFGSGALITDWDNDRVHYIDSSGAALPDFESSGLSDVIEESRSGRLNYQALSWIGVIFFVVVLIVLIMRAIVRPNNGIAA
jgi:hypothetical protein